MALPSLADVNGGAISADAAKRVKHYKENIGPVGAYTSNSKGFDFIRQIVCDYIKERDGSHLADPDPFNIYLTNGASEAVSLMYQMLIRNPQDGIMIPIP